MNEGTIARLMTQGYGFIAVDGTEKILIFHSNELKNVRFDSLRDGHRVRFEVKESDNGPLAVNVERV